MKPSLLYVALVFVSSLFGYAPDIQWQDPEKKATVSFTVPIAPEDALYKEYINFSCDTDGIAITSWDTDQEAVAVYDPIFKESTPIYQKAVTFHVTLDVECPVEHANLRFCSYHKSHGHIKEIYIPLTLQEPAAQTPSTAIAIEAEESTIAPTEDLQEETVQEFEQEASWYCRLSDTIEHTSTGWLRMLFIFLLGMLLSLTPCIYPMIPITVGILQGQGAQSFGRNLFLSLCYTAGIATTFALLGLFAAYTGSVFGSVMQSPLVVFAIVALLMYLAGSMFGFYEMYVPTSLSGNSRFSKGGSPVAAFLFGAVSGTVASPCISPGLALVLSIVTKLASPLLGFTMLFVFGVGLSTPLLVIGTFSGALNVLPTAGMWMVEVKKLFGFMMLAMCLYFLQMVLPAYVIAWLWTALMALAGIYYTQSARHRITLKGRLLYTIMGIGLVTASIVSSYYALRATAHPEDCTVVGLWADNYACALEQARHENKPLLVKVEAVCCSLCTAINKKFFAKPEVQTVLDKHYIAVRIDGGDSTNPDAQRVVQQFGVIGFPTLIMVNPHDESIIKKWEGEFYSYSLDECIEVLSTLQKGMS